jgi:hypothetical protein
MNDDGGDRSKGSLQCYIGKYGPLHVSTLHLLAKLRASDHPRSLGLPVAACSTATSRDGGMSYMALFKASSSNKATIEVSA